MSFNVRLKSAFGPACLFAALLALPRFAGSQSATQVHPITGLPLPPEDGRPATRLVPAAIPGTTKATVKSAPAAKPVVKTAATHTSEKKSKKTKHGHPVKAAPAPAVETAAAPPAPAVAEEPEAATVSAPRQQAHKSASHKGHHGKHDAANKAKHEPAKPKHHAVKAAQDVAKTEPQVAAAPIDNTVHPIRLPLPPDEEPETVAVAPKPAVTPKVETPKPAVEAKHDAVKPVPVMKPAEVKPAPATVAKVEAPKASEPKHEVPSTVAPKIAMKAPEAVTEPKHEVRKPEAVPAPATVAKVEAPKASEPKHEVPATVATAPKIAAKEPEAVTEPKHELPAPVTASVPVTKAVAPTVVKPEAEVPKPSAVIENKPTSRPPVTSVEVPTAKATAPSVVAPKSVVVPSSVVPDEMLSKPVPAAPATTPKPAKPLPTLKPRTTGSATVVTPPAGTPSAAAAAAATGTVSSSVVAAPPILAPHAVVAAPPVIAPSRAGASVVAPPKAVVPSAAPAPAAAIPDASAPPPPPPGTLGHIIFQGAAPFTDAELAPLTGLTIGAKPTNESLQIASSRLIETGLFSNVKASYETPNDIGTATFTLEALPASQLARVSFANFVWMTPAEIEDTLRLLPLYRGVVPMGGNLRMAESIQATLEGALSARGVQATLTHELIPPSPQHPYTALEFRVLSPNVVLGSASLFDIPPALVNRTLKAQADAVKVSYNEGIAGTTLSDILLAPARNAGYIGARLWHIERKRHPLGKNIVSVDYVARMDAGPIYTVRALSWEPTSVLSKSEFDRLAPLHVGQTPTSDAVAATQQVITDAYYAQGYMEANISAKQELDTKTGAAYYTYSAVAGPQYRVHHVEVRGLNDDAKRDFDAAWTMKPGDVYNEGYLLNFLNAHQNITSLKGYTFTYDRSTAPDTHQVDLTLTFKK
ncbi:POTRA domain-containing protein [Granulicella paludicola]|uniref:POTRA domain-containing protein n=1 Tax=Granulicella paludicola TaxID=474951 RepID=UPI0021E06553|nr:POTRA domain-containing protein [Granulicella paludicola]